MTIIIPMSGRGQRFIDRGYIEPKPLIMMEGKPIIEHVVDMFSKEDRFIFICANDHLIHTNMRETLMRIVPHGEIIGIEPHKLGPIHAVRQVYDLIPDDEEVIVNYCDFGCYWDYADFLDHTRARGADGAIPAYKGFHPHMLGTTNYAFMRDEKQWMLEIQEKKPFTDNRMDEYASSGTYYFRTGEIMKRHMDFTVERGIALNGEYYVSVVYNLLIESGLKVSIYEIQHMLQWGTPEDVAEYEYHSAYFRSLMVNHRMKAKRSDTLNLIPLAGEGARFKNEGYVLPKPLIEVSGREMILQAFDVYPSTEKASFVVLKKHCDAYGIDKLLESNYPGCRITRLDSVTEGQAITASLGLEAEDMTFPLLIAACDNGLIIDAARYDALTSRDDVDVICFTFKNNPTVGSNPNGYGYVVTDESGLITGVSVKKPVSDKPMQDHAIVGAFYFRKASMFMKGVQLLRERNIRVNNEFYIDSIMGLMEPLKLKAYALECAYESWGTPNDYETYRYWQSFFHKAAFHPYTAENDAMIPPDRKAALIESFYAFGQAHR